MSLFGKVCLLLGGSGFIGSHLVSSLPGEKVAEVRIFDNICKEDLKYLKPSLKDQSCWFYKREAEIPDIDLLNCAMKEVDYVFHLAALWLLHSRDFPRVSPVWSKNWHSESPLP